MFNTASTLLLLLPNIGVIQESKRASREKGGRTQVGVCSQVLSSQPAQLAPKVTRSRVSHVPVVLQVLVLLSTADPGGAGIVGSGVALSVVPKCA